MSDLLYFWDEQILLAFGPQTKIPLVPVPFLFLRLFALLNGFTDRSWSDPLLKRNNYNTTGSDVSSSLLKFDSFAGRDVEEQWSIK